VRHSEDDDLGGPLGALLGSILCFVSAGLLSQDRDAVGQAVVVLVLVLWLVVAAAIGGRFAALITAATAALSFNYFHTTPYLTLRIESGRDIAATLLLFLVGVVAGEMTVARERRAYEAAEARSLLSGLLATSACVAEGRPIEDVWTLTRDTLVGTLHLAACRFEPFGTEAPPLPRISAETTTPRQPRMLFIGRGFALPEEGAELAVMHRGDMLGRIVVLPAEPIGLPAATRRSAVIITSLFAAAAAASPPRRVLA